MITVGILFLMVAVSVAFILDCRRELREANNTDRPNGDNL